MPTTRRQFLLGGALAVAAGSLSRIPLAARQAPPDQATAFTPLRANVGIFTGKGGTIGYYGTADALVVVDTQFPDTASRFWDGIVPRSHGQIDALLNTHHHADHTAGNSVLGPHAATIVAHARVPALQKAAAQGGAAGGQVYANQLVQDRWERAFGRETVSARHYGPGHTGGDLVVTFENADVVHMGDLVFNRMHPFIDRPGGASVANWIALLDKVAADHGADTLYVFGHGREGFGVTGRKADLAYHRDYLSAVMDAAKRAKAAGRTREELVRTPAIPGFPDHVAPAPTIDAGAALGVAYDELTGAQ